MFAVGDMHASMGDGEICFTGVEIAGEVDIRFGLLKGKQATLAGDGARRPLAPARDRGDVRRGARELVSEEAARLLVDEQGFTLEDAFIFLSVACDVGIAQGCRPWPGFGTIRALLIPKIAACPAPFAP